jgi:hypothetical protein
MESIRERRNDRSERIAVRLAVELAHGDFRDPFAADVLNVSSGGISMRATCLPDVGSMLLCRFHCLPSNTQVTAKGEVVWAHLDGAQSGEFGLAFVDLDPKTEWLIEEMIAERAVWSGDPATDGGARVTTLELEGSPDPIEARLTRSEGSQAVFEQELDLLSLGRGVRAHAPGSDTLPGSIAAVELRMVGAVPMLAVTVSFDRTPSHAPDEPLREEPARVLNAPRDAARMSVEREALPPAPVAEIVQPSHDTEPDLISPGALVPRKPQTQATQLTLAEFAIADSSSDLELEPEPESAAAEQDADDIAPEAQVELGPVSTFEAAYAAAASSKAAAVETAEDRAALDEAAVDEAFDEAFSAVPAGEPLLARAAAHDPLAVAPARRFKEPDLGEHDFSREFDLDLGDEIDFEGDAERLPAWKPLLLALMRRCQTSLAALARVIGAAGVATSRTALPQVRGAWQQTSTRARSAYRTQLAPQLGALRRLLAAKFSSKRRRVTAGPAPVRRAAPSAPIGRTVVLGVIAAAALGLGVYALAPMRGEDRVDLHRKVKHHAHTAGEPAAAGEAPVDMVVAPEAAAATEPTGAAKAAPAPQVSAGSPKQAKSPAPGVAPAAPTAAAVASTDAKSSGNHKLRFGAAQVPGGRQFALRMSGRITGLQGSAEHGGFSVVIAGALSLDRAGPISSAHKSVSRAMIINRGDHAEFSVSFVDGKQPLYQVTADGNTLYVVIQDV